MLAKVGVQSCELLDFAVGQPSVLFRRVADPSNPELKVALAAMGPSVLDDEVDLELLAVSQVQVLGRVLRGDVQSVGGGELEES